MTTGMKDAKASGATIAPATARFESAKPGAPAKSPTPERRVAAYYAG